MTHIVAREPHVFGSDSFGLPIGILVWDNKESAGEDPIKVEVIKYKAYGRWNFEACLSDRAEGTLEKIRSSSWAKWGKEVRKGWIRRKDYEAANAI